MDGRAAVQKLSTPGRKWTVYHISVFFLTFFGYACFHANRKTFSNVKQTMAEEWTPSFHNASVAEIQPNHTWNRHHLFNGKEDAMSFMGTLDFAFMLAYAVGLFICGFLGDRFEPRLVISFGMCFSALTVFVFGTVTEWLHFYNQPLYIVLWVVNGLFQSSGWPAMVAVMGNWFGKSSRGFVLGLWSACASVGNIIGSLMAGAVVDYGYEYAFLLPASVLFAFGIVVFFALVSHPRDVGLLSPTDENICIVKPEVDGELADTHDIRPLLEDESESDSDVGKSEDQSGSHKTRGIGFLEALRLPGVILYSLSYACLKLVNYAFFFWLPLYLNGAFGWSQKDADDISIWYDVGGIIAGIIAGFISDRMGVRAPVVCTFLALAAPSLFCYSKSPNDKVINAVLMAVTGFFIGGPANLISSAISADMGRQSMIRDNEQALATVTGIVDGTGSVGAAIGQKLVPVIQQHLGWHWVFYSFIIMALLTLLCILPVLWREIKSMTCYKRRFGHPGLSIQTTDLIHS